MLWEFRDLSVSKLSIKLGALMPASFFVALKVISLQAHQTGVAILDNTARYGQQRTLDTYFRLWDCATMRLLIIVLAAFLTDVNASEYQQLNGNYTIAGKTVYDPPSDEAKDTHIYFSLKDKAARDLYESMKVTAIRDQCAGDGSMSKRVGEMRCTLSKVGKEYQCWFGIDLKNQRVVNGSVC